jgi:hypothetical protein
VTLQQVDWIPSAATEAMARFEGTFGPQFKRRRWEPFADRLRTEIETLFRLTHQLYGWRFDFAWILERFVGVAVAGYAARPKWVDKALGTGLEPQHELWVVTDSDPPQDLGDLDQRLAELSATHLHIRGSSLDRDQCRTLIEAGIPLVADLDLDHVPQSHAWAVAAIRGLQTEASYFLTFPDRSGPAAHVTHMHDLGGRIDGDAFSWHPELAGGRWVWSTHGPAFWDLDYRNPELVAAMAGRLLDLTNLGVTRICLSGLPLLWKQPGTSSINLPEAHLVVQILAAVVRVASPWVSLVSADDQAFPTPLPTHERFIAREECPFGYETRLTSLIWEALATTNTVLLVRSITARYPAGCTRIGSLRMMNGAPVAELAGLDKALERDDAGAADLAARRLLAAYAIVFAASDVPEIDLVEEIGSAWEPSQSPGQRIEADRFGPQGLLSSGLARLAGARRASHSSATSETTQVQDMGDIRLVAIMRGNLVVLINTAPEALVVNMELLPVGFDFDLLTGDTWTDMTLAPYGIRCLVSAPPDIP